MASEVATALLNVSNPASIPQWIQPLAVDIYGAVSVLSWYVGGIFGLYLIFAIISYLDRRKLYKRINNIDKELKEIKYLLLAAQLDAAQKSKKNSSKK